MSYGRFAYVYDRLMDDVPYHLWLQFLQTQMKKYSNREMKTILDLACGTGEISVPLAEHGYEVVGIDLSDDMLAVANAKAQAANQNITFLQQDMSELQGLGTFDMIVIFCDSLNYLPSSEDVIKTFKHIHTYLKEDGLFFFDVHSVYKMDELFIDQTYAVTDEEVSYIWNCFPGESEHSVEHELSFFVRDEGTSLYERFDETHYQRTYDVYQYKTWLEELGFEILEINGDFDQPVSEQSERIFFSIKKKGR
ncbi:class I SAM-dependent DNA methyltransferase [Litchfieldia alkalitelluris]|uniref:class I SAM-dependent DNA methyltransferase n=1 Tax=Litchfieldia alkalitelluris TaxID=304268 RepID=UPI000996A9B1|nr:class I SAM-dependent methyltransferase [Litchfieldia alkalitelluris]